MRTDLLGLTPDSLAALTNRGLVKRAGKEAVPELRTDEDGTVHGDFPGGPATSVPTGGLDAARCTCGATTACRHVIAVILAYQRLHAEPAPAPEPALAPGDAAPGKAAPQPVPGEAPPQPAPGEAAPQPAPEEAASQHGAEVGVWSPGEIGDDQLTARIGARLMAAARRAVRAGFAARVRRASAVDPVPQVELPSATVRFLVPGDLGFVHTDSVAGVRDDVIALAVWAFRVADERHPGVPDVRVDVGGEAGAGDGPGLGRALGLAGTVLREGAAHLGEGLEATVADVRRHLDAAGLRWPLLAVEDLAEQLAAYRDRGAHYRPELVASHVAELHARHRAVTGPGATLRSSVLGTAEAAETPLRRARLESLGCRVRGVGYRRIAEVYLAHGDNAMVLVLRREWDGDEDGPALARRRVASSTLGALATGNLVTESAVRSASRTVRLATGRISRTTVSPSRGDWGALPPSLVVSDYAALGRELDALPLRPVRPRIEAELVRVVAVAGVETIRYAPGDQRLDAVIADGSGNTVVVSATHTAAAPGRLDALAAVLAGVEGEPRFVSGVVGRRAGALVIEPLGVAAGDRVIVPDLRAEGGGGGPVAVADDRPEPLAEALIEARGLLAEVAHHGLVHLPPAYGERLAGAAHRLTVLGLRRVAGAVTAFERARAGGAEEEAVERAWVDAYLRVEVALDLN
ncbi:hypothetical protein BKM31_56030 [[Actinomadura] parvosata subsp. kistnae]|uniref:SWIM-type domain-containing protein n=1 Tax=[Actinomadura] parvosata subsp. kistnae TaxID=1909395 RepID=A0A1V0AH81_9ACTN|nr:hypothetical protein [Nonomuraea sp. ATCC 55076]AQZ69555.1 hypothetical protein BKM31_56030 [Nonomuraea sp. ATCC 55076]